MSKTAQGVVKVRGRKVSLGNGVNGGVGESTKASESSLPGVYEGPGAGSDDINEDLADNLSEPADEDEKDEAKKDGKSGDGLPPIGPDPATSAELIKAKKPPEPHDFKDLVFGYDMAMAGASTIVIITKKNDSNWRHQSTHPNTRAAHDLIEKHKAGVKKEIERRIEEINTGIFRPLPGTPGYGKGITVTAGEMVVVSRAQPKEQVVVIAELVGPVTKWLNGRAVEAHRVRENGLVLVTHPDGQKRTFMWEGGHVHES